MKGLGVSTLLVLSVVLTVISAFITYLNVLQKKEATTLIIHNYKVIQASTRLLSQLKDMEIGHRGYLITADTTFLQPYQEALKAIDFDIDTLNDLVKEKPRQRDVLLNRLLPLINKKKNHLAESFTILKKYGRDSAAHFAGMRIEKERMDSIHLWTQDIINYERTLLREGNASLEQRYFINDVIRFSSFALIGVTSLAALITITNKERTNQQLLEELKKFNQQLEAKVRDRTHELQEANRDLVRLNDEKNHFLAIATHDLRAPLAGISGLLSVMKLDKEQLSSRHLEYIQLMEETSGNMEALISDLLDLSRIEQGTHEVTLSEINVARLFGQMHDRFATWASKKNITLSFQTEDNAKSLVSDSNLLARILDNLISNAIKFSPRSSQVMVVATRQESAFCFDVHDEGPGIKPEERGLLFRRFQKLSARPTDGENSSGLGLSIVRDIADLLKGSVTVLDRSPNKGTTFRVTLPNASNQS